MSLRRAIGARGSWFGTIDGVSYPCVHEYWYKAGRYDDPHAQPGQGQWDELIAAINAQHEVILTKDTTTTDGLDFSRTGYIGLFEVDRVEVEGSHLRFRMVRRLESLQP